MTITTTDLDSTLHERFALEHFRPGQREVIENVLGGRDVLCVMPTGGGKSLCYQLPALLLPGPTLVVSPLIALMKDQVDGLLERGLRATLLNSTLDPAEQRSRLAEIEAGQYDLIYVAPERFRSHRFVETITRVRPALLAVDEAHCISEWGHDFRPDYARIGHARRQIGSPPCIALTATATDLVRRDIADQLGLRDPAQFVTGFDRPNLSYAVVGARRDNDKLAALAETLERTPGSAIVYASSRARCESVAAFLQKELKRPAVIYHAGLTREERAEAQDRFMAGEVQTVVATNAFGMGVDKADIRSVVHFNLPGTLEAYYQEAGRAGRDGDLANCVLLYAPGDRFLQEMFIENEYPPPDAVFRVYEFLRGIDADPIELTHAEIKEATRLDLNESAVGTALKILEGSAAIERFRPRENMAIVRINAEADEPSFLERVNPNAPVQQVVLRGIEGIVNRRFGEPIYFHPDDFAAKLGLDRGALTRAIKVLAHDLPIDYVPPFRGNAVRVNDRALRARDIQIDFAALSLRRQREYDKLERMIKYAESANCRRAYILGYFGDAESSECGRCDNCGPSDRRAGVAARPIDTEAGREVILKALSGVARTKGRFGKTIVAQMLTGSSSEKMARMRLKELSTFGILATFRQPEVVQILDALASCGLVQAEDVDRFRPILNLSAEGRELCKQPEGPWPPLTLPDDLYLKVRNGGLDRVANARPASPSASKDEPTAANHSRKPGDGDSGGDGDGETTSAALAGDPLYIKLRALRAAWAKEINQSAYTIFPNQTLEALVLRRPKSPHELAGVKGMGSYRLERYGSALLAAIGGGEPDPVATPAARPATTAKARTAPPARPKPPEPILEALKPAASAAPRTVGSGEDKPAEPTAAVQKEPSTGPSRPYISTEEWTWKLLGRGFTLDEAAAIRGLEPSIIVRHATWIARQGRPVPLEAFLAPETLARWAERHRGGETNPPPESEGMAGLWSLYLACQVGKD